MHTDLKALKAAVHLAGGQSALARLVGGKVKQGHVWHWLNVQKRVPAEHVLAVEQAVGKKISRYELRPDIYGTAPPHPVVERRRGPTDRRRSDDSNRFTGTADRCHKDNTA